MESMPYSYYFENDLGGKIRIHDMNTCPSKRIVDQTPTLVLPMLVAASSTDAAGKIKFEACALIDPINRTVVIVWLDDFSMKELPAAGLKRNTDPQTRPKKSFRDSIPYRPDYNGPLYYSI